MLYRLCSICGKRVPHSTRCKCEVENDRSKYKMYKSKRNDKKEQTFYTSSEWINFRDNTSVHQLGMDLIDWYEKRNDVAAAETYHHIVELKDDWSLRVTDGNVIGLTKKHHGRVHALMNRSDKDKVEVQKYLRKILYAYEKEFYQPRGEDL